jgi:hypothetical protein
MRATRARGRMAHRPTARDGHCCLSALTRGATVTRISASFAALAVLALVACAGGSQLAPPSTPNRPLGRSADRAAPLARALPLSLSGEVLTATNVVVKRARHCLTPYRINATFTASGTATGPYPGTFSASGSWDRFFDDFVVWGFKESFTITSASVTIQGMASTSGSFGPPTPVIRCFRFGPAGQKFHMTYSSPLGSGAMSTSRIQDSQTFIQKLS